MRRAAAAVRLLGRTASLFWTTHPGWTAFLLAAQLGQGLVPVGRLWVGKLIIDGLVAALATHSSDLGGLLPLVIIEFVLTAFGAVLAAAGQAGQAGQAALGHLLRTRVGEAVLRVSTRLDYAVLEDPAFHDRLQRAQMEASFRPLNLLMQLSFSLTGLVGLIGILALLATVHVRWRRRTRVTAVPEPASRASVGLVSHHDAPDRPDPDGQECVLT